MSNSIIEDIDYLMKLDSGGVVVHQDSSVYVNNIYEWLDTKEGTVFGWPAWGNALDSYKHENLTTDLEVPIENHVLRKMRVDLPHIPVSGVRAEVLDFDHYLLSIKTPFGVVEKKI
ncbi:hypothetical protein [Pseudoalteromonas ruthenica]|uniref:hypothetical protein n=1 Tax=Pseudoalteromonas ruthenica TaxID=151081 RepID=UPI00110BC30B|nr:hypothetical protein [Pseudoalteromonas ruthenica]TMO87700.1 hypothetical protein CWC12_10505 [Pseudoalteromonas ruthenica]TMP21505.1 hypothetical protein CWC06_18330 [Pseudoalteromonas ruthenica]